MHKIDERGSGILDSQHHQGENHVGTDKSSKVAGIVPDDRQGDRGSTKKLGDLGRVTCQCWGPIGTKPKRKEE